MTLMLPPAPKESPLRDAFRRAGLARVGLEFRAVLGHPRGAALLRSLAAAYGSVDERAARYWAGTLIRMRSAFR
jgi:hypothetical protein